MRTMELQSFPHSRAHTHTSVGLWECVKQYKTPAEYYQCYPLLMVMLCEVQSCSTQTPAAAALYSNGTTRHRHAVSWFLLDSASHSFCLLSFFFVLFFLFLFPNLSTYVHPRHLTFALLPPPSLLLSSSCHVFCALVTVRHQFVAHQKMGEKKRGCMGRGVYKYS